MLLFRRPGQGVDPVHGPTPSPVNSARSLARESCTRPGPACAVHALGVHPEPASAPFGGEPGSRARYTGSAQHGPTVCGPRASVRKAHSSAVLVAWNTRSTLTFMLLRCVEVCARSMSQPAKGVDPVYAWLHAPAAQQLRFGPLIAVFAILITVSVVSLAWTPGVI